MIRAKKMIWSRFCLASEAKMFTGMMLITVSSMEAGACPLGWGAATLLSSTPAPMFIMLLTTRPSTMARAVLTRKMMTVLMPIRPRRLPSPTSAAAQTSRVNTSGATTMVSRLVRMVPSGFSTSARGPRTRPRTMPRTKPIMIRVNRLRRFHGLKIKPIFYSAPFLPVHQTNRHTWSTAMSENP